MGTTGGQTGVFVIPSSNLPATPAFVTTSAATEYLAYGEAVTLNGSGAVTAYSPATYMYAAIDSGNDIHVYGLNLTSATAPTPTQIGSLSLPLTSGAAISTVICDSRQAATNFLDPTTTFVMLHIAGTTGCNTTGDVWEVVHYTDSASTAPLVVAVKTTSFSPLYGPTGALTGLELLDAASGNWYLYPSDAFTSPVTLLTGVTGIVTILNGDSVTGGDTFSGSVLFASVTTGAGDYLYRLPYGATTATLEYTATGTLSGSGISDASNVYFMDTVSGATSTSTFWAEALGGGTPTKLYSATYSAGSGYDLLGANGSLLVLDSTSISGSGSSSTLLTVPVNTLSATATTIAGPFTGGVFADSSFLQPTTPGQPSTDLVFVNVVELSSGGGGTTYSYSTEILTPSGTVKQALLSNSSFVFDAASALSGSVLQVTGITETDGGYGGGTFNALNLGTLAPTVLTTTGGAAYTAPAGYLPGFASLSSSIGAGLLEPQSSSNASLGAAYDLSKHLLVPIAISNTSVSVFD
jgi:hypothetical protein